MKNLLKMIVLWVLFSICFFWLRNQSGYNVNILVADLGGLTYLYSTVATIFAIFAAFIIFFESERWNNLVDAVKGEVGQLNELWLWSRHLPEKLKNSFSINIKTYLQVILDQEWQEKNKKDIRANKVLDALHKDIYDVLIEQPSMMPTASASFNDLIKFREKRIHYLSFRLPKMLKITLLFNSVLLLIFSILIGVYNIYLDYFFVLGIFSLIYIIYSLIHDMDNPTVKGSFHMDTYDYQELLTNINNQ
ncbi:MAG: DUF4239 domain-containing protein [Candidatus Nomurabacteria bacterium]|nr:DUF4239 domain-containing protein [Candidatus Nomurabacteria bacterium]